MNKSRSFFFVFVTVLLFSCGDLAMPDSDYKIDPVTEQDLAIRSLFFLGDNASFFVDDSRPQVDTSKGRRFGIKWPLAGQRDTVFAGYANGTDISFGLDSNTAAGIKIKNLYLTLPNTPGYWKFSPKAGLSEVKSMRIVFPSIFKPGFFSFRVGATLEGLAPDTGGVLKPYQVTVPEIPVLMSVK